MAASSSRPLATATTRAAEDERYRLPAFPSNNNAAAEILLRYLPRVPPQLELYRSVAHTGVNRGLPWCDPWNIPGMPLDEEEGNRREKYYVTDSSVLKSSSTNPATQTGFWKPRDLHGWAIPAGGGGGGGGGIGPSRFAGLKKTYDFYVGQTVYEEDSKGTSWIMDVYVPIDQKTGYHIEDDLVMCHVFKGNSRCYDPRPKCAAHHHHESPKEKGFLATQINSNKHLSPPDHAPAPQLGCVSHHLASKENGSLAAHHQGFQFPNHGCNQNTGEPNHQAICQNNDHFDMGLLKEAVLNDDAEGVTACSAPLPISTYLNVEGAIDIDDFLSELPNGLANENTGFEISMEMTENDMPNGVSSTVSASAENTPSVPLSPSFEVRAPLTFTETERQSPWDGGSRPLGKCPRTKSRVWEKFTKLVTKAKASKAVFAACNHCYKVMTGDSSKGTSHLIRHKCHCNH